MGRWLFLPMLVGKWWRGQCLTCSEDRSPCYIAVRGRCKVPTLGSTGMNYPPSWIYQGLGGGGGLWRFVGNEIYFGWQRLNLTVLNSIDYQTWVKKQQRPNVSICYDHQIYTFGRTSLLLGDHNCGFLSFLSSSLYLSREKSFWEKYPHTVCT